jgi:hypothetical protein
MWDWVVREVEGPKYETLANEVFSGDGRLRLTEDEGPMMADDEGLVGVGKRIVQLVPTSSWQVCEVGVVSS